MIAMAHIVFIYASADAKGRVELICKNYTTFLREVEGFTEGLKYTIEEEKEKNRKEERGELGVRVQGASKSYSNMTENMAISRVTIRKAIEDCDFSGGVLDGVSNKEKVLELSKVLKSMRQDYELFNYQLGTLPEKEAKTFLSYLTKEKDITGLADEDGVEYHTEIQRIKRIKDKVKCQMLLFLKREWLGGVADAES